MRDLANEIHPIVAISPAASVNDNTPIVSAIIDTAGYQSLAFLILIGSLAAAAATFAVTMDSGNDPALADAAPVNATNMTGTLTLAGFDQTADNKARKVGYTGSNRYVRLTVTPTGNNAAAFVSAVAVLADGRFIPTPNPPS